MDSSPYHHELSTAHRLLPRGVGRRWLLPSARWFGQLAGWAGARDFTRIDLPTCCVFVLRPHDEPAPALLWFHGGGLVIGDARAEAPLLRRIVQRGVAVATVQYRLAPEHPFPAALEDGEAAWTWLGQQPWVDPAKRLVGGLSAGGGLAAGLAQRLLERNLPGPIGQYLVYPMLDDRSGSEPLPIDPHLRLWDRASNELGWNSYLRGHDRSAPPSTAVPARAESLARLPPAWIGVGTLDLFHAENVTYAERLRAAGVDTQLEVVEGAYHGFDQVEPTSPVTERFVSSQLRWLEERIA